MDADTFLAKRNEESSLLRDKLAAIKEGLNEHKRNLNARSEIYKEFSALQRLVVEDANVILLDDKSLIESEQNTLRHAYYVDYIEKPVAPTNPTKPQALFWWSIVMASTFFLYLLLK